MNVCQTQLMALLLKPFRSLWSQMGLQRVAGWVARGNHSFEPGVVAPWRPRPHVWSPGGPTSSLCSMDCLAVCDPPLLAQV